LFIPYTNGFFLADPSLAQSFADITGYNLESAPPSAVSHVDQHPVYGEELVYQQNEKREERKTHRVEQGNNEQLIKEEKGNTKKEWEENYHSHCFWK
jgi:hypothetical protein